MFMKIKDIFEDNVIRTNAFRDKKKAAQEDRFRNEVDVDPATSDLNSPDTLSNEMDRRRYEKLLSTQSANAVDGNNIFQYLRKLLGRENKQAFKDFTNLVLTGKKHTYELIMYINEMLTNLGIESRIVGIAPDAEEWYFS